MKKIFSLIKASMTEDMNLFNINTKKKNGFTKVILPIAIAVIIMGMMFSYSEMIIKMLEGANLQHVVLAIFIFITSILTIIEGIYKSGNLIFNCKDDNLLLSLPIKRSTVIFVRIFKFYVFELLYNSLFILPSMVVYAMHVNPGFTYYLICVIGLVIFPIFPILISCIIGAITTFISSRFKGKNIVQTVLTFIILLGVIYFSYNSDGLLKSISENASNINDFISKVYYPAGAFVELVRDFDIIKLLLFVVIHLGLLTITVLLIGKFFIKINSNVKSIKPSKSNKEYKIKTRKPMKSLIKKEFSKFLNSPVFITNAGFGLVLFIVVCVLMAIKLDGLLEGFNLNQASISYEYIKGCIPVVLYGLICFSSFSTSITSSMISLEGKSINLLKSLPIKPNTIVQSKVLAAVLIMIPCILVGDLIVFVKFKFDILSIILIVIASILFPLISETIGIIINLKYPRMDAKNDTEVVKQSMSSFISVLIGMILLAITIFMLGIAVAFKVPGLIIMISVTAFYALVYAGLALLLRKTSEKSFNNIEV